MEVNCMTDVDGQIVLGLDIAQTTAKIDADLDSVLKNISQKEIKLSASIGNINFGNASSQIRNVTNQINQEFRSTLNVIDLVNGGIGNLSRMLQGAGFSKGSISTVTQDLQKMSLQINNITTTMSHNGNIKLTINGTDDLQRAVTIIRQYDSETGKIINSSKTFRQSFEEDTKAASDFARSLETVNNAISSNKIGADIAKVTAQYESLGKTGHSSLSEVRTDIEELNRLQAVMTTNDDADILVAAYNRFGQTLDSVKNKLSIINSESKQSTTIDFIKSEQLNKLNQFENGLRNAGILTDDFKSRISGLTTQINGAFDEKGIQEFKNNFELLRTNASVLQKDIANINAQYKQLQTVNDKIAKLEQKKVGLNADSAQYQALNSELALQYEYRSKITQEIENTAKVHPELIQYAKEFNNYIIQTSQNAAKLATEESKVADNVAKMANSYREQANNNSFENSISSLESRFSALTNVSEAATQKMRSDFETLRSLVQTISTSSDNSQVISSYNEYSQVLERVKNDLDILSRSSKNAEAATKEEAKAAKESADAMNTLGRSATLSNNIEAWMQKNTKAAEVFGDRLRELKSTLSNNTDTSTLTQARVEFQKIQSEAKAAGLTTNQFATSVKNVGLQLLGLSNGYMVLRKLISIVREGVDVVVDLDTALVDLQKTTTMSGTDLEAFYSDANKAAKELGVTTKDIIQSAADWSRMGFSDKVGAETMARLSAQFAAISPGVNIETASTGLLSTMKAYGIEVEDVLDGIMSKINIVGNTAGTSNEQILSGLSNSAAAMAAMNSSLEENIALFTAAQEITQDANKVGNALRTGLCAYVQKCA